jgi:formate dehydrogenase major subunit
VLITKSERDGGREKFAAALASQPENGSDRRTFLKRSGLAAGALGNLPLGGVRKAEAGPPPPVGAAVTTRKNICTHCSVGCSVIAKVANGGWIGQEPDYDSPINRGSHCCKGAAVSRRHAKSAPLALSGEARQWPMDPRLLGDGDRRDW